jgi:DHA1 family inner membrane transport protein
MHRIRLIGALHTLFVSHTSAPSRAWRYSARMSPTVPRHVLPVLVLAQFAGTSLWFAVNAVMPDLQRAFAWPATAVGTLTSALQVGFIVGTLVFALLALADRFRPTRVFAVCALAGAACTVGAWAMVSDFTALLVWRFASGFFLAGIYPVGMKIASQWYQPGLGAALGYLVGALVLGSASPHALRAIADALPWPSIMLGVAACVAFGGLLILTLGEPPQAPAPVNRLQWQALGTLWTDARVRSSVLGYFGHMWELYTLWVLLPLILATRLTGVDLSWAAFVMLGSGGLGCVIGGHAARRWGSARVAVWCLGVSGLCCLVAPLLMHAPDALFYAWLMVWGITVAGDSPQFSTLTARNAPPLAVGSVLTLTNSMGFAISTLSILLFVSLSDALPLGWVLTGLALGPALGLWAMRPLVREGA